MDDGTGDIHPNISPVEIIKEGGFCGTYFREIYSGVNDKFYEKSWKKFKELKDIDKNIMLLIFMMPVSVNMVLSVENH